MNRRNINRLPLSISIFRRFQFLQQKLQHEELTERAFNLHFQEISILTNKTQGLQLTKYLFQSPFSGDFNSYAKRQFPEEFIFDSFQSPFSGDFNSYKQVKKFGSTSKAIFQSPFSGDFNSYKYDLGSCTFVAFRLSISIFRRFQFLPREEGRCTTDQIATFNLHFQEISILTFRRADER